MWKVSFVWPKRLRFTIKETKQLTLDSLHYTNVYKCIQMKSIEFHWFVKILKRNPYDVLFFVASYKAIKYVEITINVLYRKKPTNTSGVSKTAVKKLVRIRKNKISSTLLRLKFQRYCLVWHVYNRDRRNCISLATKTVEIV